MPLLRKSQEESQSAQTKQLFDHGRHNMPPTERQTFALQEKYVYTMELFANRFSFYALETDNSLENRQLV